MGLRDSAPPGTQCHLPRPTWPAGEAAAADPGVEDDFQSSSGGQPWSGQFLMSWQRKLCLKRERQGWLLWGLGGGLWAVCPCPPPGSGPSRPRPLPAQGSPETSLIVFEPINHQPEEVTSQQIARQYFSNRP